MIDHHLAQQLGVKHIDGALIENLLAHEIAIVLLGGDGAQIVAPHGRECGQPPPAGGRAGEIIPG